MVDQATRVQIRDSDQGTLHDAEILWIDRDADIALLRTATFRPALHLTTTTVTPGQHVCVIANPFGLGVSISCGVVSGIHRVGIGFNPIEDFIQTDAAVNPALGWCTCRRKWCFGGHDRGDFHQRGGHRRRCQFRDQQSLLVERIKQLRSLIFDQRWCMLHHD